MLAMTFHKRALNLISTIFAQIWKSAFNADDFSNTSFSPANCKSGAHSKLIWKWFCLQIIAKLWYFLQCQFHWNKERNYSYGILTLCLKYLINITVRLSNHGRVYSGLVSASAPFAVTRNKEARVWEPSSNSDQSQSTDQSTNMTQGRRQLQNRAQL